MGPGGFKHHFSSSSRMLGQHLWSSIADSGPAGNNLSTASRNILVSAGSMPLGKKFAISVNHRRVRASIPCRATRKCNKPRGLTLNP
jgi:hypothetical protein